MSRSNGLPSCASLLTRLGQATIARLRIELGRRVVDAPLRRIEELGAHRVLAALNDDAAVISQAYVQLPLVCVNIATVIAAGNNSNAGAISAPGCVSNAISVGSTTKSNTISSFSNSASFLSLLAPLFKFKLARKNDAAR